MKRNVLFSVFALLLLVGCSGANESGIKGKVDAGNEAVKGSDTHSESIAVETGQEKENVIEAKALQDAHLFVEVIKQKDEAKLVQILNDPRLDREGARKAIEGFDVNFDLNTLNASIHYGGLAMHPAGGQYEFRLEDRQRRESIEENTLVIQYAEDGSKTYHNPYVRYFPYAENMVAQYLELIKQEDAAGLASFLNPDDLEIPTWVAEETIQEYKDFFDGKGSSFRYIDRFTFAVGNGTGKEHTVDVVYGDGLMSIKDDFIPDF